MPRKLSPGQADALEELVRRGKLTGDRAAAATELVRRTRARARNSDSGRPLAAVGRAAQSLTPFGMVRNLMTEEGREEGAAALNAFADTTTLGLSGKAQSALAATSAKFGLSGDAAQRQDFGTLYDTAEDLRAQRDKRLSSEHPVASAAGTAGGLVLGGRGIAHAAQRAGFRPAKRFTGRLKQYGQAGAAAGATEQVIREGELGGDTLASAVVGGVTGMAGGGVAEKALPVVTSRISGAWRKLAAKLQTPVEDMAAFIADTKAATGQMPSVAQAVHARDQGLLQGWAARHNTFGTAVREAAEEAPGQDLSTGKLRRARSADMDAAMESIRDRTVQLDEDLLGSPHIADAMAGPKMKDIRIKIGEGEPLTVGDVDRIRQKLRGMQQAEPGGPFGDFAEQLREDTAAQVPEYGRALERYSRQSKFIEGFEPAISGKSLPEVEDVVTTPEGRAGHEAGSFTARGQRALNRMAPTVPIDEGDFGSLREVGRGAAHIAAGSRGLGTFHAVRGMMDVLPQRYQIELAEGLLARDPEQIRATLGKLRQAGAELEDIQRLSGGLSAILGASASSAAGTEAVR
jgi:hypothetical protein